MRFVRSQVATFLVAIILMSAHLSEARSIEDMKEDRCICFRKPQEAEALIALLEETSQVKRNSEMTGNLMQLSNLMKMLKYN